MYCRNILPKNQILRTILSQNWNEYLTKDILIYGNFSGNFPETQNAVQIFNEPSPELRFGKYFYSFLRFLFIRKYNL